MDTRSIKNIKKKSRQARLVYFKNINRYVPTTWRWVRGNWRKSICRSSSNISKANECVQWLITVKKGFSLQIAALFRSSETDSYSWVFLVYPTIFSWALPLYDYQIMATMSAHAKGIMHQQSSWANRLVCVFKDANSVDKQTQQAQTNEASTR